MKEGPLLDAIRSTTISVAVDLLRTVQRVKQAAQERQQADPTYEGPETLGEQLPSPVTVSDFLGDVASLGLDQVNGILRLRARYGDEVGGWLTDQILPRSRAKLPEPQLIPLKAAVDGRAGFQFVVQNRLSRRAAISFAESVFRPADGGQAAKIRTSFQPKTIELDPGQPWIFSAELDFSAAECDSPLAPGRYVGLIDALVQRCVVHRLLVDLTLTSERAL